MSDVAIKAENLSKRYRIGQYVGGAYQYRDLRDVLTDAIHAPFRRLRARSKQRAVASNPTTMTHEPSANLIWALKDVSFEVKQGEVVGIIGRNGAGKSTLLKVLSRITEPTKGRAEIKGRIQSVLEVGTGFHPELTGRENTYLSGAILGMTKREIDRKFDEIVDFSGVKKFIDTPVKRYSSGMVVRLGFAVAAHLEPEILLIDEVLAVGDVDFQKKCLGKMQDIRKGGKTVIFVSHNMSAVRNLCPKGILLSNGQLIESGRMDLVIKKYLDHSIGSDGKITLRDVFFLGTLVNDVHFEELQIYNPDSNKTCNNFEPNEKIGLAVKYKVTKKLKNFKVTFSLHCNDLRLLSLHDVEKGADVDPGWYISKIELSENILRPNTYWVAVGAYEAGRTVSWIYAEGIVPFDIEEIGLNESLRDNIGIINIKGRGQRNNLA